MIQSVDHSIHYQDSDGFVARKEEPFELQELSDYLKAFPTRGKLKTKELIFAVGGIGLLLSACSAALPTAENPSFTPTIGPEINPDVSFGIIPAVGAKESLSPGVYPTESFCSDDLQLCVFHQFDQNGKALAPRAYTNSKIEFDLDNNAVIVTGDPLIHNDQEVWIYPPHDGQEGYEAIGTMSVEEATAWMENMSETGRGDMQAAIDEAKSKGVGVNILMKTVLNVQKNAEGKDRLVDMIGGLAISSGEEGATIVQLNDTLEPLTENELLKDQQIAGVDFVPQFDGTEKLVMEVYPSDWKYNGAQWVSTEWFNVQAQIAASGERFTLAPDGTIQDGGEPIPGLHVDPKGVMSITVGGEPVTLSSEGVSFADELNVKGYKLDEATGEWKPAQEIITTPSGIGFELGAQIEGQPEGVREVVDIVPPADLNYKEKLDWEERNNPETYGFEVGDTRWVYKDGKLVLQDVNDPSIEVAEMGNRELVWDWSKMVDENGENVILGVGKLWEMRGKFPVRFDQATASVNQLTDTLMTDGFFDGLSKTAGNFSWVPVISQDGSQGVVVEFYIPGKKAAESEGITSGYVCFWGKDDQGRPKAEWFYAKNFDRDLEY